MSYEDEEDVYNNSILAFEKAMKDRENTRDCEKMCLPNCAETTYSYTIDTTDLHTDELCKNQDTREVLKQVWKA